MLECLADMGLPITESQQKFSAMDFQLREKVPSLFEKLSNKYGMSDLTYGSFHAAYGYRAKLSAADMAISCSALMESVHSSEVDNSTTQDTATPSSNFLIAQDALSRDNMQLVLQGIEEAKTIQSLMRTQVCTATKYTEPVYNGYFASHFSDRYMQVTLYIVVIVNDYNPLSV